MRFAVLDLGSTSFQLLVADAGADGDLVRVLRDRVILDLGMSLVDGGRIPARHATQAVETVRRFRDLAHRAAADDVLPIATSALRDSANRDELGARLGAAAGAPIRFLDGEEEARLTVLGVRGCVALPDAPFVVIDLGGGSLEIALADPGGVRWAKSLPLGAGRLTSSVLRHDPPTRDERRRLRSMVRDAVDETRARVRLHRPVVAVVSGGAPGAIARLVAIRRWGDIPPSLNQMQVTADDLRSLSRDISAEPLERRIRMAGTDERRAHILPAGVLTLATVAEELDLDPLLLADWGLREGVVLEAVGRSTAPAGTPAELRRSSVDALVRAWREDRSHPAHVVTLTGVLFDAFAHVHKLEPVDRELLMHAASLHDVGMRVSPERHHKHGAYLIEHAGLRGFDPVEVAMLASIVRFQKSGGPSDSYLPYALLGQRDRRRCNVLVGLLRVAHALGRGSERDVTSIVVEEKRAGALVVVGGSGNPQGAAADARDRVDLLGRELGLRIDVEARPPAAVPA